MMKIVARYITLFFIVFSVCFPLSAIEVDFSSHTIHPKESVHPKNFVDAKRLAKIIHQDHRATFYCGCTYDKHNKVNLQSCGYSIQRSEWRAKRLEWEHIVPVSLWGQALPCWRDALWCNKYSVAKGRNCCSKFDPNFSMMESDLHNLVPEIGELNGVRSNYRFGILPHIPSGQFGQCAMKIDPETRRVEPPKEIRGAIARAYLYMSERYHIPLSKSQQQLFFAWNAECPPQDWEIEREGRISEAQGNHNPWIFNYTESVEQSRTSAITAQLQ